jgi:hypothetical protein
MNLTEILAEIKKTFTKFKLVEMKELGLSFKLEPLTSEEELKVVEACKDVEGAQYISSLKRYTLAYAIKKLNDVELGDDITFEEAGQKKSVSKFLYMEKQIGNWPSSLTDILFSAYSNLQEEVEEMVKTKTKFDVFTPAEAPATVQAPPKFRRIEEKDEEGETEVEKLNKQVENEINQVDAHLGEVVEEAKEAVK